MQTVYECEHGTADFVALCVCAYAFAHACMCACERGRGVVRESDADSRVTLGLPVFLLSMKGMT